MAIGEIHVGDVGTVFSTTIRDNANALVPLSSATTKNYIFTKSNDSVIVKPGVFVATTGVPGDDAILEYTSVSGDLDMAGIWRYQIDLVFASGGGHWKSDIGTFPVHANLE